MKDIKNLIIQTVKNSDKFEVMFQHGKTVDHTLARTYFYWKLNI